MKHIAIVVLASALAAGAASAARPANSTTEPAGGDASLVFVSEFSTLSGISYGLDAVDGNALLFDQRRNTHLAGGLRSIEYSCPNAGDSGVLSFRFLPGRRYELVCHSGQPALIRALAAEDDC